MIQSAIKMSVLGFTLAVALVFASCASASSYERMTSDDCLVLLPSTLSNKDGVPTARNYYLQFSDKRKQIKIGKKSDGYILILIRSDDVRITGISSNVGEGSIGESYAMDLNIPIAYHRGEIVVADYTFEQRLVMINTSSSQSHWNFVETKKEDTAKYLEMFMKTPASKTWQK